MPNTIIRDAPLPVFVVGSLVVACSARVARCPEAGESMEATGFIMEAGGKGFNVALAAHRLDVPVEGVFAAGDDSAGVFMRQAFAEQGLPSDLIRTVASATGAGVGLIQDDGENRIAVYPGANALLSVEHIRERAERLHSAGLVFAQFEAPDAPIGEAFQLARDAKVTTMLNPSPYRPIGTEILAATDILIVNEQEMAALASDRFWTGPYDGLAASLADIGVRTLVMTRGGRGALAWHCGARIEQPGLAVEAIDSIGAGDAFAGAVIAALVTGESVAEALRWGCAAGALVVARLGLAKALPNQLDLQKMLEFQGQGSPN